MLKLEAKTRDVFGKKLKTFRQKGELPAVLYGPKEKSIPLSLVLKDFKKVWEKAGESSLIELSMDGEKKNILIHEVAFDPVSDEPIHADFYAVQMDKVIQATVPLIFSGASEAVKTLGGVLVKVMHELEIEALPMDLPHELNVDISKLKQIHDKILIKDIDFPEKVKPLQFLNEVVAIVEELKAEEETVPAEMDMSKVEVATKKKEEAPEEPEAPKTSEDKSVG